MGALVIQKSLEAGLIDNNLCTFEQTAAKKFRNALHDFFQVINHLISVEELRGPEQKKTACYDIDVEVDDNLKAQMNSFLLSTASQQEIQGLDNKIHETVETINSMKTQREFFLSFAKDPQLFINKWLMSQSRGKILES